MEAIKKRVDHLLGWTCIVLLSAMTILVTYQVVIRYIFNSPSAVSEVLCRYLFIWMVLLGSAYVFGLRDHMNITFVCNLMSSKIRLAFAVISEFIITGFALIIMTYGGGLGARTAMGQLDSATHLPMGVFYFAIPLSGVLIVFYFFCNMRNLLKGTGPGAVCGVGSNEGDDPTNTGAAGI